MVENNDRLPFSLVLKCSPGTFVKIKRFVQIETDAEIVTDNFKTEPDLHLITLEIIDSLIDRQDKFLEEIQANNQEMKRLLDTIHV